MEPRDTSHPHERTKSTHRCGHGRPALVCVRGLEEEELCGVEPQPDRDGRKPSRRERERDREDGALEIYIHDCHKKSASKLSNP